MKNTENRFVPTKKKRCVRCKFCGSLVAKKTAHLHQGSWICEVCWDDRLKSTE